MSTATTYPYRIVQRRDVNGPTISHHATLEDAIRRMEHGGTRYYHAQIIHDTDDWCPFCGRYHDPRSDGGFFGLSSECPEK
jgi:hypothetical protein